MKRFIIAVLIFSLLLLCGCGSKTPALHNIPYPENYPTHGDEFGADAFSNILDSPTGKYFTVNDYYNMKSGGTLHLLEGFETYQQTTEYTCGCAAALMVLHRFGVDEYDELQLAELMHTDTIHGTEVEKMRDFFTDLNWQVDYHASTDYRFETPDQFAAYVIESLDAGIPILVDWADWCGHWQVIIGIDTVNPASPHDDVLILADPYDITDHYQDGYYIFPLSRFMSMWFEGTCAAKEVPYNQPFVAAHPAA